MSDEPIYSICETCQAGEAENAKLRAKLKHQEDVLRLARKYARVVRWAGKYVWDLDAGHDVLASDSLEQLKAAVFALDKKKEAGDAKAT
jgi:hypothetical protein